MRFSIGTKIGVGYATAVLALILIGMTSYIGITQFFKTAQEVEHSHKVIQKIYTVFIDVLSMQNGEQGYIISGNSSHLKLHNQGIAGLKSNIQAVRELTGDNPAQQQQIDAMESLADQRIAFSNQVVELRKKQGYQAAINLAVNSKGRTLMEQIGLALAITNKVEQEKLGKRTQRAYAMGRVALLIVVVGVPLAVLILMLIGLLVVRNISGPLRQIKDAAERIAEGDIRVAISPVPRNDEIGTLSEAFSRMIRTLQTTAQAAEQVAASNLAVSIKPQSSRDVVSNTLIVMVKNLSDLIGRVQGLGVQVSASATEIASTAQQQQAAAAEISATTMQIGATSNEIAATSAELAKAMGEVTAVSEETAALARQGQTRLSLMEATMQQILNASGSINTGLASLSEKAANINSVVTTITKVADQTNLLSLNAAIEAEKAGEFGRGFSVVATEIRRLADQTASATYDIEQVVKQIQSAISTSVMAMDKFSVEVRNGVDEVKEVGTQLSQIINQVQTLTPRFEMVNDGMQSQAQGAQQISEALAQLSESAQQTVEVLRQSNSTIVLLNDAARRLREGISQFSLPAAA